MARMSVGVAGMLLSLLVSGVCVRAEAAQQIQIQGGVVGGVVGGGPGQIPPRDNMPQKTGTSRIRGRVVAADGGQALRRAMVRLMAPELRESRTTTTDAEGRYEFKELLAGRYSLMANKGGFVTLNYGQTRPNDMGQPVQLNDAQTLDKIDFSLPRGSVITGRVVDEFGEPVAGAQVQPMQFRYMNGQRRLMPAFGAGGFSSTPDTGEFRLWGLMPGDYSVSATWRGMMMSMDASDDRTGYVPSYYPGTTNVAEAQTISVGVGETASGIVITLVPARTARVSGTAIDADGKPVRAGMIMVMQRNATMMFGAGGGQIRPDGTFQVSGLAPGQYMLRGTIGMPGQGGSLTDTLEALVTVDGDDVTGVVLAPVKPAKVTGRVTFDPPGQAPQPGTVRLFATPKNPEPMPFFGAGGPPIVKDDFSFELNAPPGEILIRGSATTPEWQLKAVHVANVDIIDSGIELFSGRTIEGVEIVMTNRAQEVSGLVTNAKGQVTKEGTVFIFSQDRERWMGLSRYTAVARPDQDGRYKVRSLPPGDYFAAALEYFDMNRRAGDPDYLEQLSSNAVRFSLRETETRTLDLKVAGTR